MTNYIHSKNVLVKARKSDGLYYPFACVEELTYTVRNSTAEIFTTGSGQWEEHEYMRRKGWELTLNGVMVLESTTAACWTVADIYNALDNYIKLELQIFSKDNAGRVQVRKGTALVVEETGTASMGDGAEKARWSLRLTGSGALKAEQITNG